jgi:hypothetical protein
MNVVHLLALSPVSRGNRQPDFPYAANDIRHRRQKSAWLINATVKMLRN